MRVFLQIIAIFVFFSACAQASVVPCGSEWINIHSENPDLIGVFVEQYPTHKEDHALYEGKHPAMVIYVFKGNRAHQLSFTPSGQVRDGFWWDIPVGHSILEDMSTGLKLEVICRDETVFDFDSE